MKITNLGTLTSHGNVAGRQAALKIIESGLQVCDPNTIEQRLVRVDGKHLIVGHKAFALHDDPAWHRCPFQGHHFDERRGGDEHAPHMDGEMARDATHLLQ